MAVRNWVLTDRSEAKHVSDLVIDREQFPEVVPAGVTITQRTRRGGLSDGVDELQVNNGLLQLSILPTRGMSLWKGWIGGQTLGWKSPIHGPVHPQFVPQCEPAGLGWLAGFDEWICRCGMLSNGAPDFNEQGQLLYPLHGQVANLPAEYVEVSIDGEQIEIRGRVVESRFHFHKLELTTTLTTRLHQPGFTLRDEVRNLSASPGEMQMLYHCNFGAPLLGAGAELVAAVKTLVPRNAWSAENVGHWSTYSAPTAGMAERVYFAELYADANGMTRTLLKNAKSSQGISLGWNAQQLPCFTLWKNETAVEDGYVTGIEPGTNFPNPRTFEGQHERVVKLAPGAVHVMELEFAYHANEAQVASAESAIRAIQNGRPTDLQETTDPDWCA